MTPVRDIIWSESIGGPESIGVVIALQAEARAILGPGIWKRSGGLRFRQVSLPGVVLLCACTGMGGQRASEAARRLAGSGAKALVSVGAAGGLDPALAAGDIVVAGAVGECGLGAAAYKTEPAAVELAVRSLGQAGVRAAAGLVVTSRRPVLTAKMKKAYFHRDRALAVDMESAAVAVEAAASGLPFFALKAVSDPSGSSISADLFECVSDDGSLRSAILAGKLLRKPSLLKELLRARREFSAAMRSLREAWGVLMCGGGGGLAASLLSCGAPSARPSLISGGSGPEGSKVIELPAKKGRLS